MSLLYALSAELSNELNLSPYPELPTLPRIVKYWDDFSEKTYSILDFDITEEIRVQCDGFESIWRLEKLSKEHQIIVKNVFAYMMDRLDLTSVVYYMATLLATVRNLGVYVFDVFVKLPPDKLKKIWDLEIFPKLTNQKQANSLKRMLHSLCAYNVGFWNSGYDNFVSNLQAPIHDPYRVVRSRDCFIPVDQQQKFYNFLDDLAADLATGKDRLFEQVRGAAIALLIDQHAFRPGTVARIKVSDVQFHTTGSIHVAALVMKKKQAAERMRITRRIKREWCPIITAFHQMRSQIDRLTNGVPSDPFFFATPSGISQAVTAFMCEVTGEPWTPTDLRHTAAQRLVDAGASADQLAEFMTHNSLLPGNVYFESSPTQAHRVNQALAISPIYSKIETVYRTKTINKKALISLPEDQQIGGAPHGIAISGIGACELGQSMCSKSPVLSCYGCRKFLAVHDPDIHESVVDSLRSVVIQFESASRGNSTSPAFTQLRHMLVKAQSISNEIRNESKVGN